jgi:hypothetical protein
MNAAVSNVDFLKAELDHSVLQSLHQTQVFIYVEQMSELLNELLKSLHVTLFHSGHDLEVGSEGLSELFLSEN